jgi:hypothetical protein
MLEHATVFCWIAIDPESHLAEWRHWDDWRLLKLHNDATGYGAEILSPEELKAIGDPPRPISVPQLAEAVDRYWSANHKAFRPDGLTSFRGLYTASYRKGSTFVHPAQAGLERHMRLSGDQVHVLPEEQAAQPPDLPALAVPMMAFLLLAYERHFGWPEESIVRKLTDPIFYDD